MNTPQEVMVSVCITTYNHGKYLAQCLDSILEQETNFNYEIIVGEDNSKDGTRELAIEYANKYPEKIRLFLREDKDKMIIYGKPTGRFNFMENIRAAKGKYLAFCDGDDYWTSPHKLQKQFDILEENPNYSAVTHQTMIYTAADVELIPFQDSYQEKYRLIDVIDYKVKFQMASFFVRRSAIKIPFSELFQVSGGGDYVIYFLAALQGPIYLIPEVMNVYRREGQGDTQVVGGRPKFINTKARKAFWKVVLKEYGDQLSDAEREKINGMLRVFRWTARYAKIYPYMPSFLTNALRSLVK